MEQLDIDIVGRIVFGYDEVAPVVVALMAENLSFMVIGRHGAGKTRLVRELSSGLGKRGFGFYDATKDDLISVAGIPDPEAMRRGELKFLQHDRSIWNKTTIVVDEITRAGKESQNMWLEILEERTCFGLPLVYQSLVATANPESYAAAHRLDEALLDRFYAVVPAPEHQEGVTQEQVASMFDLNFSDGEPATSTSEATEIAEVFRAVQDEADAVRQSPNTMETIRGYCSAFAAQLLSVQRESDEPVYISPRTYVRSFPSVMVALLGYYRLLGGEAPINSAAVDAYRYALGSKLQIETDVLHTIHENVRHLLEDREASDLETIRTELAELSTLELKLTYARKHALRLAQLLPPDEVEKFFAGVFDSIDEEGDQDKLIDLNRSIEAVREGHEELSRRVEGKLLLSLHSAISRVTPTFNAALNELPDETRADRDIKDSIRRFLQICGKPRALARAKEPVLPLVRYILDVHDGQETLSVERLKSVFSHIPPEAFDLYDA